MKADSDIKRDVEDELRVGSDQSMPPTLPWPSKNGVVTLIRLCAHYSEKLGAEAAAKRVAGVVGLANDLEVRLPSSDQRPDPEIARDAVAAIRSRLPCDWQHIRVVVDKGWVTLEGQVEWNYQRQEAERAVRRIKGVRGVINAISLAPHAHTDTRSNRRSKKLFGAAPKSTRAASRWKSMAAKSCYGAPSGPGLNARKRSGPRGQRRALLK